MYGSRSRAKRRGVQQLRVSERVSRPSASCRDLTQRREPARLGSLGECELSRTDWAIHALSAPAHLVVEKVKEALVAHRAAEVVRDKEPKIRGKVICAGVFL